MFASLASFVADTGGIPVSMPAGLESLSLPTAGVAVVAAIVLALLARGDRHDEGSSPQGRRLRARRIGRALALLASPPPASFTAAAGTGPTTGAPRGAAPEARAPRQSRRRDSPRRRPTLA